VNEKVNEGVNDGVNVISENTNNNFVDVVINELFADRAVVDSGSYLSHVDNNFCKKHNLCVNPLHSGELKSYAGIGESTTTAIGSTNIKLTLVGEKFPHSFQVIDNMSVNIIIGIDFPCKYKAYLFQGVLSLGDARITVPLLERGETLGFAGLRKQVIIQTNTQRRVGLNCSEINKQPILLVGPKNRIGLIRIAQDAADLNRPRYLTGEEQHEYPRPNGYENRHRKDMGNKVRASLTNFGRIQNYCSRKHSFAQNDRRYLADHVHASPTIFLLSERYRPRTQNYCSRNSGFVKNNGKHSADRVRGSRTNFVKTQNSYPGNQSFAQNIRRVNVENHHHQNHSNSPASEPLIEHTDDEFKVKLTNTNIYNDYGDLVKFYRDVLIERLSYILPPSVSSGLHI